MRLPDKIRERIGDLQGEIGIYYYDFNRDTSFFVGNCDVFPSLGIAKRVLMIEVFRQVEEGIIHLDDTYVLDKKPPFAIPENEYEATVGVLDFLHKGMEVTISDLVYLMMIISDNSAFNILLSIVGMDNVNDTMKKLGLTKTKIRCMLFEWDDIDPQKDNYHSVREIGSLLRRIYKKQLISTAASEQMLKILSYHQRRDILSSFSDNGISVAQQTGFDITSLHAAAIIMTDNPFVLCMSTNKISAKRAEGIMKDIACMCGEASQNAE